LPHGQIVRAARLDVEAADAMGATPVGKPGLVSASANAFGDRKRSAGSFSSPWATESVEDAP
jgi:hypothetical protein